MPQATSDIVLTPEEREALESMVRAGRGCADLARRVRIVLRLAGGATYVDLIESSRTVYGPLNYQPGSPLNRTGNLGGRVH